jgi:hypothetical protein
MLKPAQVEIGIQFSIEPFKNVQIEGRCNTEAVVVSLLEGSRMLGQIQTQQDPAVTPQSSPAILSVRSLIGS